MDNHRGGPEGHSRCDPAHVANTFSPPHSLGAAIDRLRTGTPDHLLTDPLLKEILGAGWQTVTYRQNTELMVEAWHWNPCGNWSNPEKQEGYFIGQRGADGEMIRHSWAYPLPHRGFSRGDGNGWSRLTDGDLNSYWKSNPYLTRAFTGEDDSLHPQWVMIDLGSKMDVNAIRIAWAEPYARELRGPVLDRRTGALLRRHDQGHLADVPAGQRHGRQGRHGHPEAGLLDDSRALPPHLDDGVVQHLRHATAQPTSATAWVTPSTNSTSGALSADGQFNDYVKHLPSREQTVTWPSSVDPWHAASDLDESQGDQVGFDFFFTSGITRGLPTMVPIAMLYATPEDAANEIAYLYKRHYPISWIEMGEEADGQHMLPEDYGALYLQFATAIHKLVPEAKLGGPAFEGTFGDVEVWPDAAGKVSWLGRFLDYLKAHGTAERLHILLLRTLPVPGSSYVLLDRPLPGAGLRQPHRASLEGQWAASEHSILHDGRQHRRRGTAVLGEERPVAGGLRRQHDGRGRRRHLLLPLHALSGEHQRLREFPLDRSNYNVTGYPPQYLAAQVITQGMGATGRRSTPALQGRERRLRCGRKRSRHGLCGRTSGRPVVGHARQPRPLQRSRSETGLRRRRQTRASFLRAGGPDHFRTH